MSGARITFVARRHLRSARSYDERIVQVELQLHAKRVQIPLPWFPQTVDAQAIFGWLHLQTKPMLQYLELNFVDDTLENRFLDTLAEAFAHFGDAAQAAAPCGGVRGHVIRYKYFHYSPRFTVRPE
jgi:hypothetical protein